MTRKRRCGDRKDGRKLRSLAPYDTVSPYIMVTRSDAQNYLSDKFETSAVDRYVQKKRNEGLIHFGVLHVLLAAYVRMLSQKPRINRFIAGQKVFSRHNIEINMAVKKELKADQTNTVIKVLFEPTDTAQEIYQRFQDALQKSFADQDNDFDHTARLIHTIPGLVKKFTVWLLRTLDYFGLLPGALLKVSPFHGSMFITSMGSLGIPPIYHHLYNFGNVPVFVAFGAKRYEYVMNPQGQVHKRKYIDYTIVTDERICDGFYFASGLKLFRHLLAYPAQLDFPPEQVFEDID
ncbi:MAG: hypothetical protein GX173_12805 [Ruminococcaceae bacterium]|jgi:hypothetical protein|nr:hypothetical protein [Oscillospiraceae bacterium]